MSKCNHTLVSDVKNASLNSTEAYAMFNIVESGLSADERTSLGAIIPIQGVPVSFTSERATKLFNQFFSQTGATWSQQRSIQLVSQTLSANAVEAYRICVDGQHTSGPRTFAHSATRDQVIVTVMWFSAPEAPTEAQAQYDYSGGFPQQTLPTRWVTGERKSFLFNREKSKDFTFIVTIGGLADEVAAPYLPRIIVNTEKVLMTEGPYRLAGDGTGSSQSKSGVIQAPGDSEIDPDGVGVQIELRIGKIDHTTYARIDHANTSRILWSAFLRPLAKEGGGDLVFRIKYPLIKHTFKLLSD